jgi:hypothetical protein
LHASKTHNRRFPGVFRGGQDFFDPLIVLSAAKVLGQKNRGWGGGGVGEGALQQQPILPVNEPKKMGSRRAAKIHKLNITKDDALLYSLTLFSLRNMFLTLHGIGGQDAGTQIELLDTRTVL